MKQPVEIEGSWSSVSSTGDQEGRNASGNESDEDYGTEWEKELTQQYLMRRRMAIEQQIEEKFNKRRKLEGEVDTRHMGNEFCNESQLEENKQESIKRCRPTIIEYREPLKRNDRYWCQYDGCPKGFKEKYQAKLHINDVHRHLVSSILLRHFCLGLFGKEDRFRVSSSLVTFWFYCSACFHVLAVEIHSLIPVDVNVILKLNIHLKRNSNVMSVTATVEIGFRWQSISIHAIAITKKN